MNGEERRTAGGSDPRFIPSPPARSAPRRAVPADGARSSAPRQGRSRCGLAWAAAALALAVGTANRAAAQSYVPVVRADPYVPAELAAGKLQLVGSRTMSALAALWTDSFRQIHPQCEATLDFTGSETALDQLAAAETTLGLLSREVTEAEREAFAARHPGRRLLTVATAIDALAVVVHPDNPVDGLSLPQLRRLMRQSDSGPATWGAVDAGGDWNALPVVAILPDEQSGARAQFAAKALDATERLAVAASYGWHRKIVEEVAATRGAIGVVSFANSRSDAVRVLPLARRDGEPFVPLLPETIADGRYPLTRPLTIVVVVGADGPTHPAVSEFLRYVLSASGHEDVIKDGFQPLSRSDLLQQHETLGWSAVK